ncbi:MAG: PTS fructose transporter subunit IIC, partial [Oscillospiraceae bacterium]|nr:PTS fructose transporter subunit IIC [Oscillospiraceae bacterium]
MLGIPVKVETNGSRGVENMLTEEDIRVAEAVIVAADKQVETARFAGKRVISVPVADGIHRPAELLQQALSGGGEKTVQAAAPPVRVVRRLYKYLMNGVSYMLPFLVAGGALTALAERYVAPFAPSLAALLMAVGGAALLLAGPVAAGGIAYAVADRPGLMPGFAGGLLVQAVGGGLLSALAVGFLAGLVAWGMTRLTARVPAALDSVRTMLLCPLAALLAVGLCVDALAPVFGGGGQWFSGLLGSLDGAAAVLLGCVLGAMMNVDFGGPVNKSAYLFGTAALAAGSGRVMAAVMIG